MQALSIVIAFLAILTPGIIVWLGIKWIAQRREASRKAEQDREMREQDEKLMHMIKMREARKIADRKTSAAMALHDHKRVVLRSVPRQSSSTPAPIAPRREEEKPATPTCLSDPWPAYAFASNAPSPDPAPSFSGSGGTFDGGGASGDWGGSSSDSCSSSDSSNSSDSGSCGSGD